MIETVKTGTINHEHTDRQGNKILISVRINLPFKCKVKIMAK